jgi:hypothetical protein
MSDLLVDADAGRDSALLVGIGNQEVDDAPGVVANRLVEADAVDE